MWSLMAACDVLVNLRSPTMGETSGSVIRGLSLGKPLLVSRHRLVRGAARRRGAEGPGRRVRGRRRCTAALALAAEHGRRARARRRRRYVERRARPRPRVADALRRGDSRRRQAATPSTTRCSGGSPRRLPRSASTTPASSRARARRVGDRRTDRAVRLRARACARCRPGSGSALLVVVSAVVRTALAHRIVAPVDHGRRARSTPSSRSRSPPPGTSRSAASPTSGYGVVYPVLIAPAWRLFAAIPAVYDGREGDQLASSCRSPRCRRICSPAGSLRPPAALGRGGAHGAGPVDALHGHADDGERVLPALPLVRARARADARAADDPRARSCCSSLCGVAYETRAQAVALVPAIVDRAAAARAVDRAGVRGPCRRSRRSTGSSPAARVLALAATRRCAAARR